MNPRKATPYPLPEGFLYVLQEVVGHAPTVRDVLNATKPGTGEHERLACLVATGVLRFGMPYLETLR